MVGIVAPIPSVSEQARLDGYLGWRPTDLSGLNRRQWFIAVAQIFLGGAVASALAMPRSSARPRRRPISG